MYGLHGLPLLPPPASPTPSSPSDPPAVTPDVLRSTYKVGKSHVGSGNVKNRQAVVEFSGQTMNATDLVTFFAKFVPSADPDDAKVYKFRGDPGTGRDGLEAALDIQVRSLHRPYTPLDYSNTAHPSIHSLTHLTHVCTRSLTHSTHPSIHPLTHSLTSSRTRPHSQYIMGVAPKILTEFWYQKGNDFCSDMKVRETAPATHSSHPLIPLISLTHSLTR